jgi:hypothetical protein
MHAVHTETRQIGRVDHLEVRQHRPPVRHAASRDQRIQRVQHLAHGPVADHVRVELQPGSIGREYDLGQRRIREVGNAVGAVRVRLDHVRSFGLDDAVHEQLDRMDLEQPGAIPLAQRDDVLDLLGPPGGIDPHRGMDAHRQRAPGSKALVAREHPGLRRCLDDAGDAVRARQGLGPGQPVFHLFLAVRRNPLGHQRHRRLAQDAGRLAAGVAFDASARRIRRGSHDSGRCQRSAVDPCRVTVGGDRVDRPVGHDRIELRLVQLALEERYVPSPAADPRLVRPLGRARGDGGQELLHGRGLGQRHVVQPDSARDQVHVRVVQPGQHGLAAEILHPRLGGDERLHGFVGADVHDAAGADGDGLGPRS